MSEQEGLVTGRASADELGKMVASEGFNPPTATAVFTWLDGDEPPSTELLDAVYHGDYTEGGMAEAGWFLVDTEPLWFATHAARQAQSGIPGVRGAHHRFKDKGGDDV